MTKNKFFPLYLIIGFSIAYFFYTYVMGREFHWLGLIFMIAGGGLAYVVQSLNKKKTGTPGIDERVLILANKYINNVFMIATVVFLFSLIVVKAKGITAIPIDYLFVYLLLLVLSMSVAVMVAKNR